MLATIHERVRAVAGGRGGLVLMARGGLPPDLYDEAEVARPLGEIGQGNFQRARERAEAVLAGEARPGGDAALSAALTALFFVAWDEGRVVAAVGLLRAAVRRSDRGPRSARIHPRLSLATLLTTLGEFDEAGEIVAAT